MIFSFSNFIPVRRYFVISIIFLASPLYANPTNGVVSSGTASITSITGNNSSSVVTITQSSPMAIINWGGFSIAAGEKTLFLSKTNSGPLNYVLNRVTGSALSDIEGTLFSSHEVVYLINQNGILIGPSGIVQTAGFVASTRGITDINFLNGNNQFSGTGKNGVQNLGSIHASSGDVILIGKTVDNESTINAPQGTVGLIAADNVLLGQTNADGSSILIKVNPLQKSTVQGTAITNNGTIFSRAAELKVANGNLYALAIDDQGAITATSAINHGGRIYLTTDQGHINGGSLTALSSGTGNNGQGMINLKADSISINGMLSAKKGTLILNASGTITPTDGGGVNVGSFLLQNGNWMELPGQNGLSAITPFAVTSDFELLNLSTFQRCAGGDGSSVNPFQITDIFGLQGVIRFLDDHYILTNNIDATSTRTWNSGLGFVPLGTGFDTNNVLHGFNGSLNGQGHTINGLTIDLPHQDDVGLFGALGNQAVIKNLGLTGTQVSGNLAVGALVGLNEGTLQNIFVTGSVRGSIDVGGLAGANFGGSSIQNSYTNVAVFGDNYNIGGLAGLSFGAILDTYSYGAVSGSLHSRNRGGLIGYGNTNVQSSYWLQTSKINVGLSGIGYENSTGTSDNTGASLENLNQLSLQSTFDSTWNFTPGTGVWALSKVKNNRFPFLQIIQ